MNADFESAAVSMESGYCLWVGAGVTRQLAGTHGQVPLWSEITAELEWQAGIEAPPGADFPHRLQRCHAAIGDVEFQRSLRRRYVTELAVAVLAQVRRALDAGQMVPASMRALAKLGALANPIVSFNIEPFSSLMLARPGGPSRVVFQGRNGEPETIYQELSDRHQRLVYHPHGLATAVPVMTTQQYETNAQTLAFGQAIHAAFANTLAIVGMSLDDAYLREQIALHRASLRSVYWFNSAFPPALQAWAEAHDVTTVTVPWADFWAHWSAVRVALDEAELARAWYATIDEAAAEAEGGPLTGLLSGDPARTAKFPPALLAVLESARNEGVQRGESAEGRLVDGESPRAIELALRERMFKAGWSLPRIGRSFKSA